MGKPGGATMEEVKDFACSVVKRMQGHGVTVACGCGYLSLLVFTDAAMATACEENRELRVAPLESLAPSCGDAHTHPSFRFQAKCQRAAAYRLPWAVMAGTKMESAERLSTTDAYAMKRAPTVSERTVA